MTLRADYQTILQTVNEYYTGKVATHGATHKGADWSTAESQELRFEQLLKLCRTDTHLSLNDYGCGYGALARHMLDRQLDFTYSGFDISEAMIAHARRLLADAPNCTFFTEPDQLAGADYTVASGIFNVRLDVDTARWETYIRDTIEALAAHSRLGFAFNMLTGYADPDRMRADLYYGDPLRYFEYCRKTFSRHVALLHDYRLYEFTLLVRLDA